MSRALHDVATGTLFGVALNYQGLLKQRLAEFEQPPYQKPPIKPVLFIKTPNTRNQHGADVVHPGNGERLQPGPALGVVIGKTASRVRPDEALDYVAGYVLANDISERSFQIDRSGGQWSKGKGFDTFGPVGPWLVTRDEIADPQCLDMWLDVNGVRRQTGSTAKMIFKCDELVAYCSRVMTLEPGDLIITGTPPGVGLGCKPPQFLKVGDVVELGVAGLGQQRQVVVAG